MKHFVVQDLPYRRTLEELAESPFVMCLNKSQKVALGYWCMSAAVGEELTQGWFDEEGRRYSVSVRRVI